VAVPRKEEEGRKPQIMHRDLNFQMHVTDDVNKAGTSYVD
jgi:hypothetical protein